jgi:AGZA family xanthine/uracil permease-like MFS transporter
LVPKPAVFPILIFIGLEITAQSFHAVPRRHYAAVAFACVPALAFLGLNFVDRVLGDLQKTVADLHDVVLRHDVQTLRVLSNGFVITSLLWASGLAAIIDRRLTAAASYFAIAAGCTLFGVIHSPLPGGAVFLPMSLGGAERELVFQYGAGYAIVAVMLAAWDMAGAKRDEELPAD